LGKPTISHRKVVNQMHKKKILILGAGALVVLLAAGAVGVGIVAAQEPTPEPPTSTLGAKVPFGGRGGGRGGFGPIWGHGDQWTTFDAVAKTLGLTPEELFAELHAGKTLEEIATEQGVEMTAVQDAMNAAQGEATRQAIEQAVKDGRMSQEQADWMLEGIEQGFLPMGHGFGHGWGGHPCPEGK
jgi:hypothetical protein